MVWNIITALATIAILILVFVGFVYTDIQIQEAKTTTVKLEQLVNKSSEQLETLNLAITEIAHQTIMEAYQNGSPYTVEIAECEYNEEKNKIFYRLIVYDKKGDPSTIKFKIKSEFYFYTVDENNNQNNKGRFDRHDEIYEPTIQKTEELLMTMISKRTIDVKDEILYITADFKFAPYSDAKHSVLTEDSYSERPSYLSAFAKFDDQNIWVNLPEKENTMCN